MYPLLSRQLDLFCPAGTGADLPGLYAAVDATYAGDEDRLQAMKHRLRALQERAQQTEKLAAIGQLAAGVAHEINNPVSYVCSNSETLGDYLEHMMAMLQADESSETLLYAPQEATRLQARRAAPWRLLRGAYRVPTTGNGVAAPHLLSRGTVAVALTLARHDRSRS